MLFRISSHRFKSLQSGRNKRGSILFSILSFFCVLPSIWQLVQAWDLSSPFMLHDIHYTTVHIHYIHFFRSNLWNYFNWSVSFLPTLAITSIKTTSLCTTCRCFVNYSWLRSSFFNIKIYFSSLPFFSLLSLISLGRLIGTPLGEWSVKPAFNSSLCQLS